MIKNCLNITKSKISKKYFFGKITNTFKSKIEEKIEEEESDISDVSFKNFANYILERKEYKWRDYEAQIEVSIY